VVAEVESEAVAAVLVVIELLRGLLSPLVLQLQ